MKKLRGTKKLRGWKRMMRREERRRVQRKIIDDAAEAWLAAHRCAVMNDGAKFALPSGQVVVLTAGFEDRSLTTIDEGYKRSVHCNSCGEEQLWSTKWRGGYCEL